MVFKERVRDCNELIFAISLSQPVLLVFISPLSYFLTVKWGCDVDLKVLQTALPAVKGNMEIYYLDLQS